MRIVSKKEFLALPAGTVYSHFEPDIFEGFRVKGTTCDGSDDFFYDDLIGAVACDDSNDFHRVCDVMQEGKSVPADFNQTSRDGLFEDGLYAVYGPMDVQQLIICLQKANENVLKETI